MRLHWKKQLLGTCLWQLFLVLSSPLFPRVCKVNSFAHPTLYSHNFAQSHLPCHNIEVHCRIKAAGTGAETGNCEVTFLSPWVFCHIGITLTSTERLEHGSLAHFQATGRWAVSFAIYSTMIFCAVTVSSNSVK